MALIQGQQLRSQVQQVENSMWAKYKGGPCGQKAVSPHSSSFVYAGDGTHSGAVPHTPSTECTEVSGYGQTAIGIAWVASTYGAHEVLQVYGREQTLYTCVKTVKAMTAMRIYCLIISRHHTRY